MIKQVRKFSVPLLGALTCSFAGCIQSEGEQYVEVSAVPDTGGAATGGAAEDGGSSSDSGGADDQDAHGDLALYYHFVETLRDRGFVFMNFGDFWSADKSTLPQKLIVLRHDVHHRDIDPGYEMHRIEQELLPPHPATYFVMLGFSKEADEPSTQQDYLNFIAALKADHEDVQPHISPNDMYVDAYKPRWRTDSLKQLTAFTAGDYNVVDYSDGVEIASIAHDVLDIRMMNVRIVELLRQYNRRWHEQTGLTASYYAAHGSRIPINLVLNNATLLDQRELIASGVYEFDTYNTRVHDWLADISDNELPDWMEHPESITPGRYQFLAHPRQWEPDKTELRHQRDAQASAPSARTKQQP